MPDLPARPAVQLQGPDAARRLPGPPADRQPHADRGRPPERAGARSGARDRRGARLPAGLEPHGHRRLLDASRELRRLYQLGGIATARLDQAPQLAQAINLPAPRTASSPTTSASRSAPTPAASPSLPGAARRRRPATRSPTRSTSYKGNVSFDREVTGERTFDLNTDGVAHYGLVRRPARRHAAAPRAARRRCGSLFRSAEAYLEMWERATS